MALKDDIEYLNSITEQKQAARLTHHARYKRVNARRHILIGEGKLPTTDAELRELTDCVFRLTDVAFPRAANPELEEILKKLNEKST